jgi:hypothetical protein
MNGDIIKSFLVGLGFEVDDSSLGKFNKSIADASKRVTALYTSIKLLAAGVFYTISKISEGFEQMGYEYRIIAPALNKTLVLRRELLKAYALAGVNIVKTIQQSIKFNMALSKLQFTFKAIMASVATKFFPMLTKQMDIFRRNLNQNMPRIIAGIEKFVAIVFKAFEFTSILGARIWSILTRIYDFFYKLHKATDGWSTVIGGVILAWKALNLAFLATPLGMIIAGLTAILLLFDDYETWKEGGKSFFDWSAAVPVIEQVTEVLGTLKKMLEEGFQILFNTFQILLDLSNLRFDGLTTSISNLNEALTNLLWTFWKSPTLQKLSNFFLPGSGSIMQYLASLGTGPALAAAGAPGGGYFPNAGIPLGAQGSPMNTTNQNVNQQTQITVNAAADANATGNAVANQQSRINFDMVRNMRGAAR